MPEPTTLDFGLVTFHQNVHKLPRTRVLETMRILLEEERPEAHGSSRYDRSECRTGYRIGSEKLTVTTSLGAEEIEIPRGRVFKPDGGTAEYPSELLARYPRRSHAVDDAALDA